MRRKAEHHALEGNQRGRRAEEGGVRIDAQPDESNDSLRRRRCGELQLASDKGGGVPDKEDAKSEVL